MKYFKAEWNETRGDEYDHWGKSIWFLELDEEHFPIRQIEVYENGIRLKYDRVNFEDSYGMLGDQPISPEEIKGVEINKILFEAEWSVEGKKLQLTQ
ncbi:MAG: hypothetical protein MK105_15695 [Crocinitomicaceae bacterium]|nr:hypothetical protein [Crocinitomicaceae bacterium]